MLIDFRFSIGLELRVSTVYQVLKIEKMEMYSRLDIVQVR